MKDETFEARIYEKRDGTGWFVYLEYWGQYNKYPNGRLLKQEKCEVEYFHQVLSAIGLGKERLILVDGKPQEVKFNPWSVKNA